MWSDEFDKKLRGTREGSHHVYDDKAWNKMELLLDKHLPQNRRRRFILLLLLPLALIGTGVFFALQKQTKNDFTGENTSVVQPAPAGETVSNGTEPKPTTIAPTEQKNGTTQRSEQEIPALSARHNKTGLNKQADHGQTKLYDKKIAQQPPPQLDESAHANSNKPVKDEQQTDHTDQISGTHKNKVSTPVTQPNDKKAAGKTVDKGKKDDNQTETKDLMTETKSSKTKNSPVSKFGMTVSAGPDLSSINFNEPGEWRMQYGIGIMYALSKKISLRAGFYVGRKIYTADPEDYHSGYNPPPSLQKIEANCLVHEIPVSLVYNFSSRKKHNWFVAGGLSSYLMKEETYEYAYKDPGGQLQYYTTVYKNENSHIFSVLNLSGGYQYHFSDRFSLMAEPYVKIPLSGVGHGNVHLNSGGILFTAGFKPFLRKD